MFLRRGLYVLDRAALCALVCLVNGCGHSGLREELDLAAHSVQVSLDSWKRGERASVLRMAPRPIEFFDDHWERSAHLVEYAVTKTYMDTDGTARCAVGLTVQYPGKEPERVRVTYQIVRKENRVVIARDPMS